MVDRGERWWTGVVCRGDVGVRTEQLLSGMLRGPTLCVCPDEQIGRSVVVNVCIHTLTCVGVLAASMMEAALLVGNRIQGGVGM